MFLLSNRETKSVVYNYTPVILRILLFVESAIYSIIPFESIAMPHGLLNPAANPMPSTVPAVLVPATVVVSPDAN